MKKGSNPTAVSGRKSNRVQGDDKPPIVEAGPIIIKSGPDDGTSAAATPMTIESVLYDISDKDKKKGRKYQVERMPMRIINLAWETDISAATGVDLSKAKRVKLVITIDPS